jgi:hypothetical protein
VPPPGPPPLPQGQVGFDVPNNPPQAQAFYQALIRLGLSQVAAQEVLNNGITSLSKLRTLPAKALDMLLKQITKQRDAQAANPGVGIFIPFFFAAVPSCNSVLGKQNAHFRYTGRGNPDH